MAVRKGVVAGGLAVVAVVAIVVGLLASTGPGYTVKLVLPSAAQLVSNSPVWIEGRQVGSVSDLEVRGNRAIATVSLDHDVAPLHEGTTSRIEWVSVLGERVVTLYPGPAKNAALPSGYLLEAPSLQIEADQVLAAFDTPTRQRLNSLIASLNGTLDGRQQQLHDTLTSAGPTVQALGQVLKAVGQDGPAIRELIDELHQVIGPAAQRQAKVAGYVDDLTALTRQVAPQQAAISQAFAELPSTLSAAKDTLDLVPSASRSTVRLLEDFRPAADRLPSVARNLNPVLRKLRPTLHDLRPTLEDLRELLHQTPDLLNSSHTTFPQLRDTTDSYTKALSFLRPYSPEAAGFFTNWGKAFSGYDSQGHVWTGAPTEGLNANDESVAQPVPAGVARTPAPGHLANQPWSDANGDGER